MERANRAPLSTFYAPGAWGPVVELDDASAHHASVKRLVVGDPVRLTSGDGRRTLAVISALGKRKLEVSPKGEPELAKRLPSIELWAPVGDRDRMLWLAEKATELGVAVWRPVIYRRSRSVSPRGEGDAFRDKVRARMIAALEQSGGAWLPTTLGETTLEAALAEPRTGNAVLLDAAAEPLGIVIPERHSDAAPLAIALGPEGGLDAEEREAFLASGWRPASLGPNVLRFETAAIAALAIIRSHHW